MFSGEVRAFHPKFEWRSVEEVRGREWGGREERHTLPELLEAILNEDTHYVSSKSRRSRRI